MAVLAWIFGSLGGLCTVMGIITAVGVIELLGPELTWMFWVVLSAILFLITLIFTMVSAGSYE